ncbi:hypothetical protein Tco_1289370 [Tanacetum coccineum]
METKDTLSSCSDLDEQEIQQLQKQAKILKENSLNKLNALQTTIQHLSSSNYSMQLNEETLHEKDSNSDLRVIKVQFDQFIHSKVLEPFNYNSYGLETRKDFKHYTQMEPQTFKEAIIQNIDSIEQCIVERSRHEQEIQNRLKRLNERMFQIQECMVQKVKASDASSGEKDCSRIVSDKENDQGLENYQGLENQSNTSGYESSRSGNEYNDKSTFRDDTDIRPSYDTESMVNVFVSIDHGKFVFITCLLKLSWANRHGGQTAMANRHGGQTIGKKDGRILERETRERKEDNG